MPTRRLRLKRLSIAYSRCAPPERSGIGGMAAIRAYSLPEPRILGTLPSSHTAQDEGSEALSDAIRVAWERPSAQEDIRTGEWFIRDIG